MPTNDGRRPRARTSLKPWPTAGRACLLPLSAALAIGASGCGRIALPRVFAPGSSDFQRRQAHQFDPYPDRDIAGGDTTGTRPLDYLAPPPEPQKARWEPASALRGASVQAR